jgi:hypothetical protein
MINSTKVAPPHSLVLVMDSGGGDIPESMGEGLIASTDSCIAIGCKPEIDGATDISLGSLNEMDAELIIVFDGFLPTPNRSIIVKTVFGSILVDTLVQTPKTAVRIGVNDQKEPDRVFIGVC